MNSVVASAQKDQPSEKVIKMLTTMAYSNVPGKIKDKKSGKEVIIDKKKPNTILVPIEDARRVIKVGYVSGQAQNCGLEAYQIANYQTMMNVERKKKKWTPGQLLFINRLHLMTVMMTTGQVRVSEKSKPKEQVIKENQAALKKKKSCPAKQTAQIKKTIEAYVDANKS